LISTFSDYCDFPPKLGEIFEQNWEYYDSPKKTTLMNILLDFLVRINHQNSHKVIQGLGVCALASLALGSLSQEALADLTITQTTNATAIGAQLAGSNVNISGVTINQGSTGNQTGTFTGGSTGTAGPLLGIENGVLLVTGTATTADGPNRFSSRTTGNELGPTSTSLATVDPGTQYDTVTLQFNVVPTGNTLSMEYLFASEEYNEFVCTTFNDAMGIFVSGPGITGEVNIAKLDQTLAGFSINEINRGVAGAASSTYPSPCNKNNSQFFVNNIENYNETITATNSATTPAIQSSYTNVEYDGFTKPLAASFAVQPNQTYTIKVVTADIGDAQWDGGVFVDVINSYNLDYGDAPDSYKTSTVNQAIQLPGPARHSVPLSPNVYLGALPPDVETNGTPATSPNPADGDDNTGDDEDAFGNSLKIPSGITSHSISGIPVRNISGQTAKLMGWIDFNKDGDFLDTGEQATVNVAPNQTTANLSWAGFSSTSTGNTYARFRITTDAGLISIPNSAGLAIDGEVEDYQVAIAPYDYGDAPDTAANTGTGNYRTTAGDGGAAQAVINTPGQILKLGGNLDQDDGSLQDLTAQADDTSGTSDDEDGVNSFPTLTTTAAQTYVVPVNVSNNVTSKDAFLVGYIDFNKDGDFDDAGEKSDTVTVSSNGTNPRTFNVTFTNIPTGITTGNTYARFRLAQDKPTAELSTGASSPTDNGEVEDYQIAIAPAPTVPTSVTTSCPAPATLVSPAAFTLNSSNYLLDSPLQSSVPSLLPLSLYNGTMRFNATLSPNATWQDGVRLKNDATFGNYIFLQPKDTNAYLTTTGKKATYEFSFSTAVNNFSTVVGGINNYDGTTIVASYQGSQVPISAANFSNLSTGMTLSDTNIDTDTNVDTVVSTNTTGGVEVTDNIYTLTIPGPIDRITVYSGKEHDSNSTATIGFSLIGYCANFDYGDAPDTYGTDKTANNSNSGSGTDPVGARHGITSTLKLGTNTPDAETDAQTPLDGTGDGADEDGITTFPSLNTTTNTYSLTTTVNNSTGNAANVYGWVDFDRDGKFDGDERATVGNGTITLDSNGKVPTGASGTVTLTWNNLGGTGANIVDGASYARIRLTTDSLSAASATTTRDTASVGNAANGEVEDYAIAIAGTDYGDAPDTYGTDKTANNSTSGNDPIGASHAIASTLKLGNNAPDAEANAQTPLDGTGDGADEDGISTFPSLNTATNTYSLTTTVSNNTNSAANVYGWVDFDRDGKFDGDERATVGNGTVTLSGGKVPIGASGTVTLTWNNLGGTGANIVDGSSYARIRLTTDNLTAATATTTRDTASVGSAANGEVEDYAIAIAGTDYGDAPDTYGTDRTANNSSSGNDPVGASHVIVSTLKLGNNAPDAEANAQTPLDGTGDGADEDGITTFPSLNTATNTYSLTTTVSNTTRNAANVYAWIDFDRDGKFDGDERATVGNGTIILSGGKVLTGANGTVTLTWNNLGGTGANIVDGSSYARIRLTTDNLTAATATTTRDTASVGNASDGEVEDYAIAIAGTDYGDAPDTYGTDKTANNSSSGNDPVGASHVIVSTLKLGNNAPDAEANAQTPLDGTGDGADEDGITTFPFLGTFSNTYKLTTTVNNTTGSAANVYAWIDFDRDGKFDGDERATVSNGSVTLSGGKVPTGASGTIILTWNNLGGTGANIIDGSSYARIRLTTDNLTTSATTSRDTASVGNATNGEVEDYKVEIIKSTSNPDLPPDFCQGPASSRTLLFILDDSSSVTDPEVQQQRDAVMATLNSFVAKGLTGQAAIVGFDANQRTVINYTNITATNLPAFQTALTNNYGVPGSGTNWEAGFQAGITLGANQPDAVFFFTDGVQTSGATPEDEAQQFKNAGAHIYGIGIGLTIGDGFRPITKGNNSISYNGSNILDADFVRIDDYNSLQTQYTNDFLANLCPADFGDAPDTYGTDYIANNNGSNPLGANHRIVSGLYLGATAPDKESNGFVDGTDNNNNATDDDAVLGTGTGNGNDEGSFTFPTLNTGKKGYRIPAANITVTNTTTQSATLHAWIDFDKNGKFDPTEYASVLVNSGTNNGNLTANLTWSGITVGATGNTFARFRLTSDSAITNNTPGGAANNGEVEDYLVAIATASDPNLLLVKRITAINPGKPDEIQFNNFVDDSGTTNDNDPLWPNPNVYLRGAIDAGKVKPSDEVEYTVYFLSSGKENAKEVNICDVVPDQMTFVKNTYGVELGIGLGLDSAALPTSPNLKLSNLLNDDQGDFYGLGTAPPTNLCKKVTPANTLVNVNGTNNDNGTVVVKIPNLPKANTPGSPTDSYGFIRFRAKVK
jgi:hypothetical protein